MDNVFDLIEAAGVAVAIWAAIYARQSARSAKRQAEAAEDALRETRAQSAIAQDALQAARRQNEIALHEHRLSAYKALLAFRLEVTSHTYKFSRDVFWSLWKHVGLSEFYFSEEISTSLGNIVEMALKVQTAVDRLSEPDGYSADEIKNLRNERDTIHLQLYDALETVNEEMRKVLRLVARAPNPAPSLNQSTNGRPPNPARQ